MLRVHLVVPRALADAVDEVLDASDLVVHIVVTRGAVRRPDGDRISFDVPLESANTVLRSLRDLGLTATGAITVQRLDMVLSATADAAVLRAPGDPTEAVVWEEVKARIEQDSRLTPTWLILMVVAVLIAGIGIITDSAVLIVGAMVVGPEYGPVASVAVGLHLNTWSWVRRGLLDLAVGFGVAVPAAGAMAWLLHQADRLPDDFANGSNVATAFISRPDLFSVLVAALAGVAGTLSLTLARSGTLVGVLISVTTVPAAAGIGAYAAEGRYEDAAGSLAQLLLNLFLLAAVGALTLRVQRRVHLAHTRRTPAPIRPRAGARDPRDRRRS